MINIMYACNDAYARQTLISMVSVVEHQSQVAFYLVYDGLSLENQQLIASTMKQYGKTVHFIEMEKVLSELELGGRDRHPKTIYAKLFIDSIIREKRILYLDSDVVVNDSLAPLFERDMTEELVAGVLMPYSSKVKKQIDCLPDQPYICDGVVLFNLELWHRENKAKECRKYIMSYGGCPPMLSEGVLNHVSAGKIGILEPQYNLMPSMIMYSLKQIRQLFRADCYYQADVLMQRACENPVIVHFMSELYNRPWNGSCEHPYRELYWKIERRVFGDNQLKQEPLKAHVRRTVWLKKHLPFCIFAMMYQIKNRN